MTPLETLDAAVAAVCAAGVGTEARSIAAGVAVSVLVSLAPGTLPGPIHRSGLARW